MKMRKDQPCLYSIGYATKPIAVFIAQLVQYSINAVADVRSVPYSKAFHDYHREPLAAILREHGIRYVYLGEELGPRSQEDAHYDETGQVQFDRLAQSALYERGIGRLQAGLEKGMNIALMCAEKDPADCHRSLLIGYDLRRRLGVSVNHINHGGGLERQEEMEQRLSALHGTDGDLFSDGGEQIELAWRTQCRSKAYRRPAE